MEEDSEAEKTASAGPIINIDNDNNVITSVVNEEIFEPSSVIRKMKSSSLCWKFLFFKGKEGTPQMSKVFCKLCTPAVCLPYNSSTSNLVDHMKRRHKEEFEKAEIDDQENKIKPPENKISNYLSNSQSKVYKWPKTSPKWKEATHQMAKWLCKSTAPDHQPSWKIKDLLNSWHSSRLNSKFLVNKP